MRRLSPVILGAGMVLVIGTGVLPRIRADEDPSVSPPNILLICWDTVRADHLSHRGYSRPTSPNLDRLAAEGMVLERCISTSSWTKPAIGSVMTGEYPWIHGASMIDTGIGPELPTLASRLKARGYRTEAIVSLPSVLGSQWGFGRGFDRYDDMSVEARRLASAVQRGESASNPRLGITGRYVTEHAIKILSRLKDTRFFLFLHYFDPHAVYETHQGITDALPEPSLAHLPCASDEYRRIEGEMRKYDGEICYTDRQLGTLLEEMRALGLEKNTVTILFADHGEEFLDHGGTEHGYSLYPETVHVPVVIWGNGIERESVQDVVSLRRLHDWMVSIAEQRPMDREPEPAVFASLRHHGKSDWAAVSDSSWTILHALSGKTQAFEWWPEEKEATTDPHVVARLEDLSRSGLSDANRKAVDPETFDRLRSLKYITD